MKNPIFDLLHSVGVSALLRTTKKAQLTVLSLHRISDERDYFFDPISPKHFAALLEYCCKHYSLTSFGGLGEKTNKPKLILSFDDGYRDFVEQALPIIRQYGVPCNHNLVNACLNEGMVIWTQRMNDIFNFLKKNNIKDDELIGKFEQQDANNWIAYYVRFFRKMLAHSREKRERILETLALKYQIRSSYAMMTWDDARACAQKFDVEIGCHTYHHDSLLNTTSEEYLAIEIGLSVQEMEQNLGQKINILALPNGQFNEKVARYAESVGVKFLLLVDDCTTPMKQIHNGMNFISRIALVNEPPSAMLLRTELFHARLKKIR